MATTNSGLRTYPPKVIELIDRFRKSGRGNSYFFAILGTLVVLFGIWLTISARDPQLMLVTLVGACMSAMAWYFIWESSRRHITDLLERDLVRYGKPEQILEEIERELSASPIIGSDGAITESWVISSHIWDQPLIWPIEEMDVIHWSRFRGHRWLKLYFVSGKYVILANSRRESVVMYDKLEGRFGSLAVTPEAAEILDNIIFPPDLIRERAERSSQP